MNKNTLTEKINNFVQIDMFHRSDGKNFKIHNDTYISAKTKLNKKIVNITRSYL